MHVGMATVFQNPHQGRRDHDVYQHELRLTDLAEPLGFSAERTVAFGDGENALEMLEWAGLGVAVANAHERVLAIADWVCPPVTEEGVAQVIEGFLSGRAGMNA